MREQCSRIDLPVHRQTARDGNRLAGHERSVVAGEEGDHVGDVAWLAEPAERSGLLEPDPDLVDVEGLLDTLAKLGGRAATSDFRKI